MTTSTFTESSIRIAEHSSHEAVDGMRKVLAERFPLSPEAYANLPIDEHRELAGEAQAVISDGGYVRKIAGEIHSQITDYIGGGGILIETNLYLRATRPFVQQQNEAVGWHRESFYGANMQRCVNIWTPIDGVDISNTLRFVPGSQTIPGEDITAQSVEDGITRRFASGKPYFEEY